MRTALTIAGSDSGGGAGIQADLKTFAALEVFGTSAITSVTAQHTVGVWGVYDLLSVFISRQIDSVLEGIAIDATCSIMTKPVASQLSGINVLRLMPLAGSGRAFSCFKQVRVCAHSLEVHPIAGDSVDQQPIGLDMALTAADEVADETMVTVDRIQRFPREKAADNDLQFVEILTTTTASLQVFSELLCIYGLVHQIPSFRNRSSASSQTTRSRPVSEASNVRFVVAVGTTTSNGSPSRSSTCL